MTQKSLSVKTTGATSANMRIRHERKTDKNALQSTGKYTRLGEIGYNVEEIMNDILEKSKQSD